MPRIVRGGDGVGAGQMWAFSFESTANILPRAVGGKGPTPLHRA